MQYSQLCKTYEDLEKNPSRLKKTEILAEFLKKLKNESDKEIIYLLQGKVFPDFSEKEFGISDKLCVKALEKASGISTKEIINQWKQIGDLGKVSEKIISTKEQDTLFSHKLTTEKVISNLQKLPELEGKGAVDRKLALISELLTSSSPTEAKYIIRTLLNDLRIGVASGTIRDSITEACLEKNKENTEAVQDAYDKSTDWKLVFEQACKGIKSLHSTELTPGKPVKVMLFLKEESIEKGFERVGKPCLADYKYDGFRMMINKTKDDIKIFTRRLDNVTPQFPDVKKHVKEYVEGESFILDSEAAGYNPKTKEYRPFQEISQRIKRKYNIEEAEKNLPIEINVFDILYYNGKSLIKTPFKERREIIEKIVKEEKYKIRPSKAIITDNIKEVENFYKEAIAEGEEGIMMKNLEAPYKPGARVGYGIKIKPSENDFDLVITKAEYGTGKRVGWLTSYTVACKSHNQLLEIGKVSTGLKEKPEEGLSFEELTKKLKPLITEEQGRTVEVQPKLVVTVVYQNIQKSPKYSSGFALRFPRITRLRPDRDTEDIATLSEVKREYRG